MALKLNERYPGRYSNPSADYPQGSFKNRTSPTAKDGSYLEQDWANDKEGFFQSLISAAGVVPSGAADKVGASQYYDSLLTVIYAAARKTPVLNDTGTAGAYAAVNTPPLSSLPSTGYMQRVKIANLNPGASTYAPDGLAAKPIYGLGLQPLQGGELPAGIAVLMYLVQAGVNGGNGAWIIIESLGGASQIANGTKSRHALAVGQIPSETLGGAALVATQALTDAGADDATVVTPKKLRFGFSSIFANNGYIVFPSWLGGFIIQWIRTTNLGSQGASSSFPLAFPTACFGVWGSSTNGSTPTTISAGAITLTTFTAYGGTVPVSFGAIAFGR